MPSDDTTYDHERDRELFTKLRLAYIAGELDPTSARLTRAPAPLAADSPRLVRPPQSPAKLARVRSAGIASLRAGEVAALVLNGGLATRFGGRVKGVVPVLGDDPRRSFLALKLGSIRTIAQQLGARIPAVVMCSFATRAASEEHLRLIDWAGIPSDDRLRFDQSRLPRIDTDANPLPERAGAEDMPQRSLYAAPGHGDTLGQALRSGLVDRLRARGIRHVLISNVDNLGATVDPLAVGLHLRAVEAGAQTSVEVVRRRPGEVGGCMAQMDDRAVIIEGFRLPPGADPERYPYFNTNTLWLTLDALASDPPLTYFPVRRRLRWSDGLEIDAIQFERLIGQLTEHVPAATIEVDRDVRFVPIKTREDLENARPWVERRLRDFGVQG